MLLHRAEPTHSPARDDVAVIPVGRVEAYHHVDEKQAVDRVGEDSPTAARADTDEPTDRVGQLKTQHSAFRPIESMVSFNHAAHGVFGHRRERVEGKNEKEGRGGGESLGGDL